MTDKMVSEVHLAKQPIHIKLISSKLVKPKTGIEINNETALFAAF